MKYLTKLRLALLYLLIPALFFSYCPIIPLGTTASMNLELSLPLIILALYALLSLPAFCRFIRTHFKALILPLLFPLYLTLSILWSANPLRALLTAGIFCCLIIAIIATYNLIKTSVVKITTLRKILYLSTFIICLFCWLQCFLDLAGLDRDQTLLCAGCTYRSFGFPHPNGFAIEPQFMGNLLLAPCLLLILDLFKGFSKKKLALTLFFTSTLFLTFSRGAIYSFVLATAVATIYYIYKSKTARPLLVIPIVAASFSFTLVCQGIMADLSPTSDTFTTGVTKSIHQLSLGRIDLRPASEIPVRALDSSSLPVENSASTTSTTSTSSYNGYVAESTDIRLSLTRYALELWRQDARTIFFGVGLGAAGPSLHQAYPEVFWEKEIIQNEYASLLLELGLVGIVLAAITIIIIIYKTRNTPGLYFLLLAYAVSLLFFSGLPNALHIYLFPLLMI